MSAAITGYAENRDIPAVKFPAVESRGGIEAQFAVEIHGSRYLARLYLPFVRIIAHARLKAVDVLLAFPVQPAFIFINKHSIA
jgi:hypothetical protein